MRHKVSSGEEDVMKGVAMKIVCITAVHAALAAMFISCATTGGPVPVSGPAQSFGLEKLSFRAPPGQGWQYVQESAPPVEYVLFMKRGAVQAQGFLASVSEVRADSPVTSEKDLEKVLKLYFDEMAARGRYEILKSECGHDESFSNIGVLCFTEVREYHVTGTDPADAVTTRGHGYAFVHPADDRTVGVVEFYERGLSEKLSADTKTMLGQFSRNVKLQ
jgi:hypothetical protein